MRKGFVGAVVMLVAAATFAQQPKFAENIHVTVVEVPVTVFDKAGKAVRGLTREQFEVTVDGKKVAITGFDVVDLAMIEDQPVSKPLPPVVYRNFLLLFDLSHSTPGTIGRAQAAAKEFVQTQLKRRDLVAVATNGIEQGLNVVTSFTSDRAALLHAIDTLGVPQYVKVPDGLRIAPPLVDRTIRPSRSNEGESMRELALQLTYEEIMQSNRIAQVLDEENLRSRIHKQLRQFGAVARLLDSLAGQKQVVLLSEGFDPSIVEARTEATDEDKNRVLVGEVWTVTSEQQFGSSTSVAEINEMAEIFRRTDVTLHAIDIKGLRSDVDASEGVKPVSNDALYYLTRPTGGTVFANASHLGESFARLMAQQEVVYVLAFESQRTFALDRFHPIKVKVRAPGNPRVSHRAGFFEKSPAPPTPVQESLALADLLMKDAEVKDVALSLLAVPLPAAEGEARVPIVLELPGGKLLGEARDDALTVELFVYAFDEENQVSDFLQQRLGLDVAKHGEKLRGGGLRYVTSMRLPAGSHVIKALVRTEETGRIGLTRTTVTVPAVSNAVFFGEPSSWINVAAPDRGEDAVAAFSADGRKFSPSANPALRKDVATSLAVFVDESKRDVHAEVIAADGSVESVTLPVLASDPTKLLLEFRPGVAVGEYRLRITAGDTHVDLPFRVQ